MVIYIFLSSTCASFCWLKLQNTIIFLTTSKNLVDHFLNSPCWPKPNLRVSFNYFFDVNFHFPAIVVETWETIGPAKYLFQKIGLIRDWKYLGAAPPYTEGSKRTIELKKCTKNYDFLQISWFSCVIVALNWSCVVKIN